MNSYTQHIKQRQQTAKQQVIQLLGWDELRYAEMQYRTGRQYLQSYIPNDPEGIDALERSRIFWAWWKNQWLIRDTAFLNTDIAKVSRLSAKRIYEYMHNAEALAHSIYPNGTVLDESYALMIDNFNKEVVNG